MGTEDRPSRDLAVQITGAFDSTLRGMRVVRGLATVNVEVGRVGADLMVDDIDTLLAENAADMAGIARPPAAIEGRAGSAATATAVRPPYDPEVSTTAYVDPTDHRAGGHPEHLGAHAAGVLGVTVEDLQ